MADPEFTPEQIELSIAVAIKEKKFEIVVSLIHLLALQAPERAQIIIDEINKKAGR